MKHESHLAPQTRAVTLDAALFAAMAVFPVSATLLLIDLLLL